MRSPPGAAKSACSVRSVRMVSPRPPVVSKRRSNRPETHVHRDGKQPIVSVEGFLFPDTYAIDESMSATQILKMMVNEFLTVAGELKFADNVQKNLGISPMEALLDQ